MTATQPYVSDAVLGTPRLPSPGGSGAGAVPRGGGAAAEPAPPLLQPIGASPRTDFVPPPCPAGAFREWLRPQPQVICMRPRVGLPERNRFRGWEPALRRPRALPACADVSLAEPLGELLGAFG